MQKIKKEFDIDKSVFEDEDDELLSKKEKKEKEILLKAYEEIEEIEKQQKT